MKKKITRYPSLGSELERWFTPARFYMTSRQVLYLILIVILFLSVTLYTAYHGSNVFCKKQLQEKFSGVVIRKFPSRENRLLIQNGSTQQEIAGEPGFSRNIEIGDSVKKEASSQFCSVKKKDGKIFSVHYCSGCPQ